MKNTVKTILFLSFLFLYQSIKPQGTSKIEDQWLTNFATVEFVNGKIFYKINERESSFLSPSIYNRDWYYLTYNIPRKRIRDKDAFFSLDCFIENFEVKESDAYEKNRFIKAATLELIWSTILIDLFSSDSFLKLQALTQEDDAQISSKAKQAVSLYHKIQAQEYDNSGLRPKLNGFMDIKVEDSKIEGKLSFIHNNETFKIVLKNSHDEIIIEKNIKMSEENETKFVADNLKAGTYFIHLYFNNKEMESKKFIIVN